jgi:lactate permease
MKAEQVRDAWAEALKNIRNPAITLIFATALVSIFRLSEQNPGSLPSMPMALAKFISEFTGRGWPMVAGYIGGLGSFITGSNTISDLLFGEFQWSVATTLKLPHQIMIAVQAVGGAFGNMVCINNVVAVCAVVGLAGKEGMILKRTVIPFVLYGLVVGGMAFVMIGVFAHLF